MEHSKDNQRTEAVIKFFDYQTLKSSPFGGNRVGERAYKRAERLASAIVLLTNHLSDSNNLKLEVRKSSLSVLFKILDSRDEMRSINSVEVSDLQIAVRKTISLVRLLAVGGSVSIQNAEIVIEAFDELVSFMNASRRSSLSDNVSFSREDLIDTRDTFRSMEERRAPSRATTTPIEVTAETGLSTERTLSPAAHVSSRGQAILEVLRANGELGIRDVAENLPEYSEKMIQRELAELITQGKVKKSGLKRWSRYSRFDNTIV